MQQLQNHESLGELSGVFLIVNFITVGMPSISSLVSNVLCLSCLTSLRCIMLLSALTVHFLLLLSRIRLYEDTLGDVYAHENVRITEFDCCFFKGRNNA